MCSGAVARGQPQAGLSVGPYLTGSPRRQAPRSQPRSTDERLRGPEDCRLTLKAPQLPAQEAVPTPGGRARAVGRAGPGFVKAVPPTCAEPLSPERRPRPLLRALQPLHTRAFLLSWLLEG